MVVNFLDSFGERFDPEDVLLIIVHTDSSIETMRDVGGIDPGKGISRCCLVRRMGCVASSRQGKLDQHVGQHRGFGGGRA